MGFCASIINISRVWTFLEIALPEIIFVLRHCPCYLALKQRIYLSETQHKIGGTATLILQDFNKTHSFIQIPVCYSLRP
jgi:hypothetical protein